MRKFITVDKDLLARVVVLVDEAEVLSEKLEDNNQELRILLHSLVSTARKKKLLVRRSGVALALNDGKGGDLV